MAEFVIVRSATHTVEDAAFEARVSELAGRIAGLGDGVVESVATFYQTNDATLVSKDGHATLIHVVMAGDLNDGHRRRRRAARDRTGRHGGTASPSSRRARPA